MSGSPGAERAGRRCARRHAAQRQLSRRHAGTARTAPHRPTSPSRRAAASRRYCRSCATLLEHEPGGRVQLFYGNRHRAHHVSRGPARAQGSLPGTVRAALRHEPRAAGCGVFNGRIDAPRSRACAPRASRCPRVDEFFICGPGTDGATCDRALTRSASTAAHSRRTFRRRDVAAAGRRAGETASRRKATRRRGRHGEHHRRHGRPSAHVHDARAAARRCSMPPNARDSTCHFRAVPASARPAARRLARGEVEMDSEFRARGLGARARIHPGCQARPTTADDRAQLRREVNAVAYRHDHVGVDGGVARLTLNRPDRLNSFNVEMHAEVRDALGVASPPTARACWC